MNSHTAVGLESGRRADNAPDYLAVVDRLANRNSSRSVQEIRVPVRFLPERSGLFFSLFSQMRLFDRLNDTRFFGIVSSMSLP
jgi:hypothetical protein